MTKHARSWGCNGGIQILVVTNSILIGLEVHSREGIMPATGNVANCPGVGRTWVLEENLLLQFYETSIVFKLLSNFLTAYPYIHRLVYSLLIKVASLISRKKTIGKPQLVKIQRTNFGLPDPRYSYITTPVPKAQKKVWKDCKMQI